jgi:hypothetical protein
MDSVPLVLALNLDFETRGHEQGIPLELVDLVFRFSFRRVKGHEAKNPRRANCDLSGSMLALLGRTVVSGLRSLSASFVSSVLARGSDRVALPSFSAACRVDFILPDVRVC